MIPAAQLPSSVSGRGTEGASPASSHADWKSYISRASSRAIILLPIGTCLSLAATSPALATTLAGTAEITLPGELTPIHNGASNTPYGVALPRDASCPGDTAHRGYHVFSYLVPRGVSPTVVSFKTGVPSRWFGYIADGAYFGAINTAEGTGQIVGLPTEFNWSRLTPQDLFGDRHTTATWEGGIACANVHGVVTNYWNTEVVFRANSTDTGGFTWSVATAAPAPNGFRRWMGITLLVVALALSAMAIWLSRRRSGEGQRVEH